MLYEIKADKLLIYHDEFNINRDNLILTVNSDEFNSLSEKYSELRVFRRSRTYNCTQIEIHNEYIYSAFFIPSKINVFKKNNFDCIMFKNRIIFIDDNNYIDKIIENLFDTGNKNNYSLGKFFYEILSQIIFKDLIFLEEIEEKLSKIENNIINDKFEKFNSRLSEVKKLLLIYYRHYSQLLTVCDNIKEIENGFFEKDSIRLIGLFSQRVDRLRSETELLREYSLQIQDVYQAEISVRQNDIMKILTIVTTVVLPLSLLTGWYGMNFKYMPELNYKYGYLIIILVSVIIIIFSLILFKKKKYF
ncbi:MAG: CorA family divalent cation transporter [Clostridia bacterium]|nr:CorA family divalent cation transporter [Clostridia bacterium]